MFVTEVIELSDRMRMYIINNSNLLTGKEAMLTLYHTLSTNPNYIYFCEEKVIMTWGVLNYPQCEFAYHHNVLVNNNTTFNEFWKEIGPHIQEKYIPSPSLENPIGMRGR